MLFTNIRIWPHTARVCVAVGDRSAVALTVRGNRVEIVIDAGDQVRSYDLVATRNGHRVEINTGRGIVSDRSDPQSLAGALRMRPCR